MEVLYPDDDGSINIVREIEFSPEYHAAGISILQNFGKLLRDKYRNTPVKVTISQEGMVVKMIVVPPDGKKLEVEEYLHKYGLVVKGEMSPEEFLTEPQHIMELKTELSLARTRIELQREQMELINSHYMSRVASLEEQVDWLRGQVGNSLSFQQESFKDIINSFVSSNKRNNKLIKRLIDAIDNQNQIDAGQLVKELRDTEPESFGKLKQFISNTVSSTGANAPAWIEFLSKIVPP